MAPVGSPCRVPPLWFPPPQSPVSSAGRPRLQEAVEVQRDPHWKGTPVFPQGLCWGAGGPGCASARCPAGGAVAQGDGAGFRHHGSTPARIPTRRGWWCCNLFSRSSCLKLRELLKHLRAYLRASEVQQLQPQTFTARLGSHPSLGNRDPTNHPVQPKQQNKAKQNEKSCTENDLPALLQAEI